MKKLIFILLVSIGLFLALTYISVNSGSDKKGVSVLINIDNINDYDFKKHDSVLVAASLLYKANELKTFMQGEHYREAWSTPIKVPIVFLDTLFGGSKIIDVGGGKQTNSLKLEAKNGIIYTLRSINKNPKPLIPDFVKSLGLENIIVDGISAQHPYAAIPVAHLSQHLNLLHTHPKIVFLPKQKLLGIHNEVYGNKIFMLEYETKGSVNWTSYKNVIEIIDTDNLIELKNIKKDSLIIDKAALIKHRLFDFIIGDWDRHAKQWGWVLLNKKNKLKAIPLAGDRDNAFFDVSGVIPSIISNPNLVKELRSFEKNINNLSGLVQPFDRYFLIHTDIEIFVNQANIINTTLTDDIIDEALSKWPNKIKEINGEEIREKIISRRNHIIDYAINFKKLIDKQGVNNIWPLKGCEDIKVKDTLKKCF